MSKNIQPFFYVVAVAGFAYYAYRMIKSGLTEPEPTYEPDSYAAALMMDSSPNYDYELPTH